MATPCIHPQTSVYYLRRQIPKALRLAFGGCALHKQSLRTKDVARAALLFIAANGRDDATPARIRDQPPIFTDN